MRRKDAIKAALVEMVPVWERFHAGMDCVYAVFTKTLAETGSMAKAYKAFFKAQAKVDKSFLKEARELSDKWNKLVDDQD